MRRIVSLVVLLFCSVPFGVSLAGCHKVVAPTYCNGADSGVQVGQLTTLDLEPRLTGISLNQGQIGSTQNPTGTDCKGNSVSVGGVTFGIQPQTSYTGVPLLDVQPSSGRLCAGSWNRNTGGGIQDFTVCTATTLSGTAFITASAGGVSSNAIAVYVHPIVTQIVLGKASTNCTGTNPDPASNCTLTPLSAASPNGCGAPESTITVYTGQACVSQGSAVQLVARAYAGPPSALQNISCLVGPLSFSAQNSTVGTIQTNGVITAAAPGSSIINASAGASQASSSAGFFATCPPASIVLTTQGSSTAPTAPVQINQNVTQNLTAIVTDTNGAPITNLALTYESTSPNLVPTTTSAAITPIYPGSTVLTAVCQPPACNTSAFDEIGLFPNGTSNGTPIFSNPLQVNVQGNNSATVLYIGSTQSQYLLPVDFTAPNQSSLIRLPYPPNSMVISQDQSTIYMGSVDELMVLSTGTNALTRQDPSVSGNVLSVSPDSSRVIITDPVRGLIYIYSSAGSVQTQYGGVAVSAQWAPDSSTVYITTTDGRLLTYSSFTGWIPVNLQAESTSVAVTVPNAGVYLGGLLNATGTGVEPVTARTVCPTTTQTSFFPNPVASNVFFPQVAQPALVSVYSTSVAASNDGLHIFGATPTVGGVAGVFTDIGTNAKSGACGQPTLNVTSTVNGTTPFTGVVPQSQPTAIPPSPNVLTTTDSAFAFVTYTGTGGALPQYNPATKTLTNIPLSTRGGVPVAPVNAAVSTDNQTLYVGTSGDNQVHILTRTATGFVDTANTPLIPALPAVTGSGVGVPNLIVLRPRKATN